MKYLQIPNSDLLVSNIALGCMRLNVKSHAEAREIIGAALDAGINFFDHADIYGGNGLCEDIFGKVLKENPSLRSKMILQTKCGIVYGKNTNYFDFSKKHILSAVDASLKRLSAGRIDVLLLHRPDALMDPDTVASAFIDLYESGKVKYFGVSNFNLGQIELLKKYVKFPLLFNQLQLSAVHCPMIDEGLNVNMANEWGASRDNGILDYCRLRDITVQPWSVVQGTDWEGTFLGNPKYQKLNDTLESLGKVYNLSPAALGIAWLLRHPAKFQPIAGTMSPAHIRDLASASEVRISREHWYDIYVAAGKIVP